MTFDLGTLLITPGANQALEDSGESPVHFLSRHAAGDWGDLDYHDKHANQFALQRGERLLSAYHTAKGVKLWVITEADRSATTILLTEDY